MNTRVIRGFGRHEPVNHSADGWGHGAAHTSTSESFLSIFKRGTLGVDQRCGERRVHPYLAEFDFRYNSRAALRER